MVHGHDNELVYRCHNVHHNYTKITELTLNSHVITHCTNFAPSSIFLLVLDIHYIIYLGPLTHFPGKNIEFSVFIPPF